MDYQLREGLFFCFIGDSPVFLDTEYNRYFMLSAELEDAFISFVRGQNCSSSVLHRLRERNLLTATKPFRRSNQTVTISHPARSVMEECHPSTQVSVRTYIEVLSTVLRFKHILSTKKLIPSLDHLSAARGRNPVQPDQINSGSIESRIVSITRQFLSARRHIPIAMSCLLDSLSLSTYLANHRLPSNLVFGVSLSPFSAHCWVQHGQIVLNETVGEAVAYTQILVW